MSGFRHGAYTFLLTVALAVPLGWFSDEIIEATGFAWLGSTFVLVIICITVAEIVVNLLTGRSAFAEFHKSSKDPQEADNRE